MKVFSLSVWVRNAIANSYVLLSEFAVSGKDGFDAAEQLADLLGIDNQLWQWNPADPSTSKPLFVIRNDTLT